MDFKQLSGGGSDHLLPLMTLALKMMIPPVNADGFLK
jgi:hypothetical protein